MHAPVDLAVEQPRTLEHLEMFCDRRQRHIERRR
jgi:hypothetical protein